MIAMLFSAGLGSRLIPLTNTRPKALVEVLGKPLLQHNLERFKEAGIQDVVINVHHFSEKIKTYLKANNNFGLNIFISDESNLLLDTGGGLKKASSLLMAHQDILLHNVDILSDIDLKDFLQFHQSKGGIASVAVRDRLTSRYLLCNKEYQLKGWENTKSKEVISLDKDDNQLSRKGFSGIHIISKKIFNHFPDSKQFNIIQWYLQIAKEQAIYTYEHDQNYWFDIGTRSKLQEAERYLCK